VVTDRVSQHVTEGRRPQGRLHRHVDQLTPAGGPAGDQRQLSAGCRVRRAVQPRLGEGDPQRRAVAVAVLVERTAGSPSVRSEEARSALGPVRPKAVTET
jgi:hypothetical protein